MRTTLDLAPDVLAAAKKLARRRKRSVGRVVSELVRQALVSPHRDAGAPSAKGSQCGFRPFPAEGRVVTEELIERLRDWSPR
jgi:hypothetical protein